VVKKSAALSTTESYFKRHPAYNSLVHLIIGLGIGILIAHPIVDPHPMRWGLGLILLGVIGHLYPWALKK
jgi:hypothetical protein